MPAIQQILTKTTEGNRYNRFTFYNGSEAFMLSIQPVTSFSSEAPNPRSLSHFEVASWDVTVENSPYQFPQFIIEAVGSHLSNRCPIVCSVSETQAIFDAFLDWDKREDEESECEAWERIWQAEDYRLKTRYSHSQGNRDYLEYEFCLGDKLIFSGKDYGCSPMHATDSDSAIAGLLSFLSVKPGDTDDEYFKSYTAEQLEFAESHGENLSLYVVELEEAES